MRLAAFALAASVVGVVASPAWALDPGTPFNITNGTFELYSGNNYFKNHLKGWTVGGGAYAGYRNVGANQGTKYQGAWYNWFTVFKGNQTVNSISQTLKNLEANSNYVVSFSVKVAGFVSDLGQSLTVKFGTQSIALDPSSSAGYNDDGWHTESVQFSTSSQTSLALMFSGWTKTFWNYCGSRLPTSIWLDNITVTYEGSRGQPVPGPIAGAGLPMLAIGAWLYARRRNRATA